MEYSLLQHQSTLNMLPGVLPHTQAVLGTKSLPHVQAALDTQCKRLTMWAHKPQVTCKNTQEHIHSHIRPYS